MIYESGSEMDSVVGSLEENSFIKQQQTELKAFKKEVKKIIARFSTSIES